MLRKLLLVGCVVAVAAAASGQEQAVTVPFRGLVVGESTVEDVVSTLGEPRWGSPESGSTLVYDSTRPGHTDAVRVSRRAGKLVRVEAASPPAGFETAKAVRARLGLPEYTLDLETQFMYEYCAHGVRFWFERKTGSTIGTAHFPPTAARVPDGEAKSVDLRHRRERDGNTPAAWNAGIASVVISPPDLKKAGRGYNKIHDDLLARCLVISGNGRTVALLGADLFGVTKHEIDPVREAAAELGVDFLLFASSHTHSAADTIGVYGYYPAEYVKFIQDRCIECVKQAVTNLAPAVIETGQVELPLDGARIEQISRNGRNPGIVDPYLTVVRVLAGEGADTPGTTLCNVVHLALHPERLSGFDRAISADYVTPLREELQSQVGGLCLFLNGPLGGMLTPDGLPGADRFEDTDRMGKWIAAQAGALVKDGLRPLSKQSLSVRIRPLQIPVVSEKLLAPFKAGTMQGTLYQGRYQTEVSRIDLGELQLIAIPGELLPELGFALREKMTGSVNAIVGLANDEIGYLIPAYDFRAGTYEESMSLGPSAAPQIMNAAFELLGNP